MSKKKNQFQLDNKLCDIFEELNTNVEKSATFSLIKKDSAVVTSFNKNPKTMEQIFHLISYGDGQNLKSNIKLLK